MSLGGSARSGRRRLGDISNVKREGLARKSMAWQGGPDLVPPASANEHSKFLMENKALLRLLAERDRIIELGNLELQKLQTALQKLQEQNRQLAQANSQMLAELNMGRDRIKVLQHKLTCTKVALKEKGLKRQITGGENVPTDFISENQDQPTQCEEVAGTTESNPDLCIPSGHRPSRNQSRVASSRSTQVTGENGSSNNRRSIKKLSLDLKPQTEPSSPNNENVSVNKCQNRNLMASTAGPDVNTAIREGTCSRKISNSNTENVKMPGKRKVPALQQSEELLRSSIQRPLRALQQSEELLRSSIQRPFRRATIGVCYKEIPVNIKMRRDS